MAVHRARPVKGLMLQALLLAALVAAPLGSLALFVPMRRRAGRAGAWSAIPRFILALAGTVALAPAVAGLPPALRRRPPHPTARPSRAGFAHPTLRSGRPS